jgi:competence protein ComEC
LTDREKYGYSGSVKTYIKKQYKEFTRLLRRQKKFTEIEIDFTIAAFKIQYSYGSPNLESWPAYSSPHADFLLKICGALLINPVNCTCTYMNNFITPPIWKKAPFTRLLPPFITGICLQWYLPQPRLTLIAFWCTALAAVITINFFPVSFHYFYRTVRGFVLTLFLLITAQLLVFEKDLRNQTSWFGHRYDSTTSLLAIVNEPLSPKTRAYKTTATIIAVVNGNRQTTASGIVIVYIQKDAAPPAVLPGDQLLLQKQLQPIRNSGNPGAFDYRGYCALQGIFHQVFITTKELHILHRKPSILVLQRFLYNARKRILELLRAHIKSPRECGLAEALLIGYKEDLDKELVQSYSNTGVVHVIAISGLHLGLIYIVLQKLLTLFRKQLKGRWTKPLIIITALWLFSFLSGASPSVLRSAVMFTCIVIGESRQKKIPVYNSLAASAFLLLTCNPFWLWDAGFQLSYIAVLSIVVFMKPVYHWISFQNKLLDHLWQLCAVTIAAQILTTPVTVYYFHQFPLLFLVSNIVAVPVSSIMLLGELLLLALSPVTEPAHLLGAALEKLLYMLNSYVEYIDRLPFSAWPAMHINIPQVILMYISIIAISVYLFDRNKKACFIGLLSLILFLLMRTYSFYQSSLQHKLIVYNISGYTAIDIIQGRRYIFAGDTAVKTNSFLQSFHLKPSRIMHRVKEVDSIPGIMNLPHRLVFKNEHVNIVERNDSLTRLRPGSILIVTGNAQPPRAAGLQNFQVRQVIIDGTNSPKTVEKWRRACQDAATGFHAVSIHGAFEINLR